jgi:quinoprotein glucose dehydrogenase
MLPGFDGGGEWGGAGYDPETGLLYVNANEMPWMYRSKKIERVQGGSLSRMGEVLYEQNCARCHRSDRQGQDVNPSLIDLKERYEVSRTVAVIQNGTGAMAGFPQLSDAEAKAITAYLLDKDDLEVPMELLQGSNPNFLPYSLNSFGRFLDERGYPAIKPPWGTLNAIDLNKGEIVWQVPLGEFKELTAQGIPVTGTENYGGPVITGSGLIFIGATKDQQFRAFDKMTGELLWETSLPAGGYATPITYEVNGKQYVVIACGGGKMGTPSGDRYVAFTLEY